MVEADRHGVLGVAEGLVTWLQSLRPLIVFGWCLHYQRRAAGRPDRAG
ncbi:hypothetical protein [Streptomyces sp. NBC_00233]|nr:hypothetical protein [Streptomyces sp. NBC_00233]MCX5232615.1 hypothetical protein [Streptomyces sp. NBC_00233]